MRVLSLFLFLLSIACNKDIQEPQYLTQNIIIAVVDGARYSESWGDTTHQNITEMRNKLAKLGNVYTNFYNNGPTYTLAGHSALSKGFYQEINNTGLKNPANPSIFQIWNNKYQSDSTKSWIIGSKGKIEVLSNCTNSKWKNIAMPSTNCGNDGLGAESGYRTDSLTYIKCLEILSKDHPNLVLLNFREPDYSGHSGSWINYLKGIYDTDKYISQLWDFLQTDSIYKGKTTLFVTNDHGRHLDSIADGFVSHGDGCAGCRHVFLFAAGPDFKQGQIIDKKRELIDIPATIGVLLNFKLSGAKGKALFEIFKDW